MDVWVFGIGIVVGFLLAVIAISFGNGIAERKIDREKKQ